MNTSSNHNQSVVSKTCPQYNLDAQAAHELMDTIEAEYPVWDATVDGWRLWPVIKFPLSRILQGIQANPILLTRKSKVAIAARDCFHFICPRHSRYVVHTDASGLVESSGGLLRDVWADDLMDALGDSFKLETVNVSDYLQRRKMAYKPSDMTISTFALAGRVLKRIPAGQDITNAPESLGSILEKALGNDRFGRTWVANWASHFYWHKFLYKNLLRRIGPKVFFSRVLRRLPAVAAAKELGIPVVECQHGVLNRFHTAYAWAHNARQYRPTMPLPDHLFVYGEYWKEELSHSNFWGDSLRVAGHPRLDKYRNLPRPPLEGRPRILVTTQRRHTRELIDFLTQFVVLTKNCGQDMELYIKLHPGFDTEREHYLRAFENLPQVHVISGNENPTTYELLCNAHLHLSVYSTCHYEALGLGVPTVILPLAGVENVLQLNHDGHAYLVDSPEDLARRFSTMAAQPVAPEVCSRYFATNALDTMVKEIKNIEAGASRKASAGLS